MEKFIKRKSPTPKNKEDEKEILVHGILQCQSVKHNCEIIHNRDKNAVKNMLKIVTSLKETGKRPDEYCLKPPH